MRATVLVTRPKGDDALSDALHACGFSVIHEPMSEIFLLHTARAALESALAADPDAVLLTSRNGASALAALTELRDLPLLCVGEATADAAQTAGFTRVSAAGGNVEKLADFVAGAYDEGSRFLYVSGQDISADLPGMLTGAGMQARRVAVYEALAAERLSDTLTEQLKRGQVDAVTFLSQRAGRILLSLLERANLTESAASMQAFTLSPAISREISALPWRSVHAAREATLASLVECVDNTLR